MSPCLVAFGEVDDDVEASGEYFGGTGGFGRRSPGLVGGLAILASLTELTALLCPLLLAYAPAGPSDIVREIGGRGVWGVGACRVFVKLMVNVALSPAW